MILTQRRIQQGTSMMAIAHGTIMATIHATLVLLFMIVVLSTVGKNVVLVAAGVVVAIVSVYENV